MALFTNKQQRIQQLNAKLAYWSSKQGEFAARQVEVIERCLAELA